MGRTLLEIVHNVDEQSPERVEVHDPEHSPMEPMIFSLFASLGR